MTEQSYQRQKGNKHFPKHRKLMAVKKKRIKPMKFRENIKSHLRHQGKETPLIITYAKIY